MNAENKTISINMENLSETEREQLLALIEKANKPQSKVWKPTENEGYYYISSAGDIYSTVYHNTVDADVMTVAFGNCFRTEEEAEFASERLNVIQELKELDGSYQRHKGEIWYLAFDIEKDEILPTWTTFYAYGGVIYFKTQKEAKNAVDTIGKERLKKYYFGVED